MIGKSIKGQIRVLFGLQFLQTVMENRYVGRVDNYSDISFDDIAAYASKAASVPESNLRMALDSIYDAINYFVTEGHAVELPYIGTFSFGVRGKATYSAEDAAKAAQLVYRKRINFLPHKDIRAMLDNVKIIVDVDKRGNEEALSPQIINLYGQNTTMTNATLRFWYGLLGVRGANLDGAEAVITRYDKDGVEREETYQLTREGKNAWTCIPEGHDGFARIAIVLDGKELLVKEYIKSAGLPNVTRVEVNGQTMIAGINNTIPAASSLAISLYGYKPGDAGATIDGAEMVFTSKADTLALATIDSPAETTVIAIGDKTYTVKFVAGGSTTTAINTLSANGVTVANGGSSTIVPGSTYNFVAQGTGLAGITASSIQGNGVVSNVVATDNQLSFSFKADGAGQLTIAGIYSVTLTAETSTIISIGGVSNGGSVEADNSYDIVGNVPEGATVEPTNYTLNAERTKLLLDGGAYYGTVRIKLGDTTLFSFDIEQGASYD